MINKEAETYQIVPETILDYFKENLTLFKTVSEIRNLRSMNSVCDDVEIILEELDKYKKEEIDLDEIVGKGDYLWYADPDREKQRAGECRAVRASGTAVCGAEHEPAGVSGTRDREDGRVTGPGGRNGHLLDRPSG